MTLPGFLLAVALVVVIELGVGVAMLRVAEREMALWDLDATWGP